MKISLRPAALILAAGVCCALLPGCASEEEMLGNSRRLDGPVIIGAVLPLTGKYQSHGRRMLNGIKFAEEELNNRRGISRRRVKVLPFDTGSDSRGAAEAFEAAVAAGANGIVTGHNTNEAEAVSPIAARCRIPTVISMATSDATVGSSLYMKRNAFTDKQQGEALAAYLWYWRQLVRISVLIDTDPGSVYERNTAGAAARAFRELGGNITIMPEYRGDDFSAALKAALITGPQAIVVSARGPRAAAVIRALRKEGYAGTICGLDSWDDPGLFEGLKNLNNIGDCLYVSYFSPENPTEEFKDFRAGFRQKFYHDPGNDETMTYDATKLLAIGLNNARTPEEFEKNWMSIHNFFGAAATYTMLPKGRVDRTIFINAVEPGREGLLPRGRLVRSFMYSKLESYRY
ncbi:MAG: ABC transporter substrate-binding protein [Lentisphaeria bacterium]|nr:ABC transporter substrate-binding protein [Lentisphaeria bacterium]